MIYYAIKSDYDETYKIKNREVYCYSKKKMKDLYPNGNYRVIGETLPRNKKEEINRIILADKEFVVSEADSHSSLLTRIVGYVDNGKGEYVALLRRNFLLLWLFFGISILIAMFLFFHSKSNDSGILPPDYELIEDDSNAITQVDENEPDDHVYIRLPSGTVEFDIESNTGLIPNQTGSVKIILSIDGLDYEILEDNITILDGGKYPDLMIDFTKLNVELKPGRYPGWVIFTAPDGTETRLPILIVIFNAHGGSVTIEYSVQAKVDLATGNIDMMYKHGLDASHDCVLQLILDNSGNEYLISQSGRLHAGQILKSMTLNPDMASQLAVGVYHGRLRVNLYNDNDEMTDLNTDIEVTITVK